MQRLCDWVKGCSINMSYIYILHLHLFIYFISSVLDLHTFSVLIKIYSLSTFEFWCQIKYAQQIIKSKSRIAIDDTDI